MDRNSCPTYDVVGLGFGPSNLALAVAAREIDPSMSCLFLERNPRFSWHEDMLLPGARMQISFLKDLALMRNPASPYTYLQYLRGRGRLERFINLTEFFPYRAEFADYLRWVADHFREQVNYGTEVVRVSPLDEDLYAVRLRDTGTGAERTVAARNVVVAPGGTPRIPEGVDPAAVIHSSRFLAQFTQRWPEPPPSVLVVGDGQSAAEIVRYLLQSSDDTEVHLALPGFALRPSDSTPFVNEQFFADSARRFRERPAEYRRHQLSELRNANYAVVEAELIDELYRMDYVSRIDGRRRLHLHPYTRLTSAKNASAGEVESTLHQVLDGDVETLRTSSVILATGYRRGLDEEIFEDVQPHLALDEAGELVFSASCRVATTSGTSAGLYGQGLGEHALGLGDTLLSMLPFRAEAIVRDIRAAELAASSAYPPQRHVDDDPAKAYALMDRFKFATVLSARGTDDPVVSQVPLILDAGRGRHGVLFGHLDRANPHVELLDDRPVTVLFHGPESFISPRIYASDQLPTWNSASVHVRGRVRLVRDRERVVAGLCAIARMSERDPGTEPTLVPDDPRIPRLLPYIVAFEIEIEQITGRFKLSQDRDETDRRLAALELADATEAGHRDFIGVLTELSLRNP